jgi:hypothetical protein
MSRAAALKAWNTRGRTAKKTTNTKSRPKAKPVSARPLIDSLDSNYKATKRNSVRRYSALNV